MGIRIAAIFLLFSFALGCLATGIGEKDYSIPGAYHEARGGNTTNESVQINQSGNQAAGLGVREDNASGGKNDPEELAGKVIPSEGILLPVKWKDIGPLTAGNGALNLTKFEALMSRNGRPLTLKQRAILENGSDDFITIDRSNSYFVLNLFWAFGLANDNKILKNFSGTIGSVAVNNLASTGSWPIGDLPGRELFSGKRMIALDGRQQAIVDEVALNTYRPCCNNPASFPDCNHGMAALGLAEWMAYQNASEEEIYDALLAANSYWFPQAYVETAAYLEYQNVSWESLDAKELLSANYSSYSGYQNTRQKLKDFPPVPVPGGGCFA